ncbi:MAG: DNA mismatch endonuclease Vsr [Chitinophagaceae bacterium]|nr:DNA mismatch endonuclease Vsr [Chitinophagaceae bacterium]
MADTFSKEERSAIMRKVKSKANKSTEQKLIDIFKANGITGWRRNYNVKGKPDFVFPKLKIAVFTDGCFWHGHHCRNITPKQNAEYWNNKRQRNINRDKAVTQLFEQRGWTVLRFWECDIKRGTLDLNRLTGQLTKAHPLGGHTNPPHKS